MDQRVLTEKEILDKKFAASKNGYNPFDVDKFLDTIILSMVELKREIASLEKEKATSQEKIKTLEKELSEVKRDFQLFKNKFKYIKEDDVIDNRSNFELIKKVNIYAKKLAELGVDVSKL